MLGNEVSNQIENRSKLYGSAIPNILVHNLLMMRLRSNIKPETSKDFSLGYFGEREERSFLPSLFFQTYGITSEVGSLIITALQT